MIDVEFCKMIGRVSRHVSAIVQLVFEHTKTKRPGLQHYAVSTKVASNPSDEIKDVSSAESKSNQEQLRLWRRLNKKDPAIQDILSSQETQERIDQLADVMDCDKALAVELIKRNSIMAASGAAFFKKIELIRSYGFSAHDIVSNPSVLHRDYSVLKDRLNRLQQCGSLESAKLSAVKQPDRIFDAYLEKLTEENNVMKGFASRTHFLAHLLDCDTNDIDTLLQEHTFLTTASMALIQKKVKLLSEYNLPLSFIKENIRMLQHMSVLGFKYRLDLIEANSLSITDPSLPLYHLLSCSDQDFVQSLDHATKNFKSLEGCEDKAHYLSFRLGCSREKALQLVSTEPLKSMSVKKLKTVLDFFLTELNLGPDFVIMHKRLLTYSITRLRHRWKILCAAGDNEIHQLPGKLSLTEVEFNQEYGIYTVPV